MSRSHAKQSAPAPSKPSAWKDRISADDYNDLKETFQVFDEDNSGTIDPEEITKALEALGTEGRNPFILNLIYALRDKQRAVSFDEYLDIVCSRVGEIKTKDGCKKVFAIYDSNDDGVIEFEEFKAISKWLKEGINDDDLLEMMHSTHVNQKTATNECVSFEEFYRIVSKFNSK